VRACTRAPTRFNQITLQDLSLDLRVAGRAVDLLTHIRAEISQIAGKCKDWTPPRAARPARRRRGGLTMPAFVNYALPRRDDAPPPDPASWAGSPAARGVARLQSLSHDRWST